MQARSRNTYLYVVQLSVHRASDSPSTVAISRVVAGDFVLVKHFALDMETIGVAAVNLV